MTSRRPSLPCVLALFVLCAAAPAAAGEAGAGASQASPGAEKTAPADGEKAAAPAAQEPAPEDREAARERRRRRRNREEDSRDPLGWWDPWLPGSERRPFRSSRRLGEPLSLSHDAFLHHLVLLPPMEGFRTLEVGHFAFDLRFEGTRSSGTGYDSVRNRFDASYFETSTRFAYGLTREFEIRAGFEAGWFRPDNEDSVRLTQGGQDVLPPDGFDAGPGVGNLFLGVKIFSAYVPRERVGLSTLVTLKIPAGKNEFLSSGRGDVSVLFCGSGRVSLGSGYTLHGHLNAGVSFFDEENVFPRKVYLSAASVYGASLVLPLQERGSSEKIGVAVVLQAQGHSNVFRKLDALNSDPHVLAGGIRVALERWVLEAGAGIQISPAGGPDVQGSLAIGSDF